MKSNTKYKDLNELLAKHSAKNDKAGANVSPTHTRIPSKELNVYGGSYVIGCDELPEFFKHYYEHVFEKKKLEHLTERQLEKNGPILLDFDFRYNYDVTERLHTKEHIQDVLIMYLEEIKEFFVFETNKPFPIYVMEKPNVNRLEDKSLTKDGIHIIIGIQMDHIMQVMLREKILTIIGDTCDLPIINSWDAVLDEGISKGKTNWQMYGSRKPGNQAYELTQYFVVTFDDRDGEFMMEEKKVSDFDISKDLFKLSAQYSDHPVFEMNPKIKQRYEKEASLTNSEKRAKKPKTNTKVKLLVADEELNPEEEEEIRLEEITDADKLKTAMNKIIGSLQQNEYHIREAHEYTQILPDKYYEPGSHERNRLVAFALKDTSDKLFLSWVMLRSKASDFDYTSIPDLFYKWKRYFKEKPNGVTMRSIMYWAKQDARDDFEKVKKNTINHYIEETIHSPTEFDFANVLYQMYKDSYVCTSIVNKTWYHFKNHRWELDRGHSLRMIISKEMHDLYMQKIGVWTTEAQHFPVDDDRFIGIMKKCDKCMSMIQHLKKTTDKNNIMREAAEIFYDRDFDKNIDSNKYLMCFKNGVVDFKNKVFRAGYPQDYISKSTNIPYIEKNLFTEEQQEMVEDIQTFMKQLFPVASLNKYMWEHLASTLIGENMNQTFNIYRGSGSNGKSILTDLMSQALGEYKGTVPITLVTDKRNSIGGTSSEVMQLKGVRYAVMQEPSKDARINEGVMKELTGGDPIQARALYCESETFIPQFDLVVCTNTLFEIASNDDGTWRRIRICDFMSKFVDAGADGKLQLVESLEENPYQYPKDKNLKDKLHKWAVVFASMMVEKAFETQGVVKDCDIVMASSNNYRQGQDHIAAFVSECVVKKAGGRIAKRELTEQFKMWFQETQGQRKAPKGVELYEYMNKKFGRARTTGWHGVEILYPELAEIVDDL